MLIVSFSFGFGGMLLIQYSYQASIKQEKRAARNSYEMILRMLKEINEMDDTYQNQTFASVLKRLNWQGLLRDSSVRLLKEQHGEVQWKQPLYYNRKNDNFRRSNGFSTKQGKAVVFQNKNKVYYQITSKISYGKETMVFQGAYDISEVYATRHQQFQMKKQDLEPMIQEAVTSMQYRLKEQDILVNLNLKKAICKIEPDLLKSLILNLIDNALKSMNSGGILTVEDRATQEGAKIYISDTGCGMPKDEISKITEAFYRIDKSRSRKQGGVGLGLAICKEIVRIHQGEMRFISQQGKGTTVIITIGGGAYEKTN